MKLPSKIKCNDKYIDSRSCCYTIPGFAHLKECYKVKNCPAIFKPIAPTNKHKSFEEHLMGLKVYDTRTHGWITITWWWMGADGWPSVISVEDKTGFSYEIDTHSEEGRLVMALAVCGSCDTAFAPNGDYLCGACRQ